MQNSARTASYVFFSAVISLLIHLLVLGLSDKLTLKAFSYIPTDKKPAYKRLRLRTIDPRELVFRENKNRLDARKTTDQLRSIVRRSQLQVRDIFQAERLIRKPKPRLQLAGLGSNVLVPKIKPPEPRELKAPRPEILEIDAAKLTPDRLALDRKPTPKLPRKNVTRKHVPSLVAGSDFQDAVGRTFQASMRLSLPSLSPLQVGELPPREAEGNEGGLNEAETVGGRGLGPLAALPKLPITGPRGTRSAGGERIEELDRLLDVTFTVYEQPDGSGFFRADITPNPRSDRLASIPKDVLFLIDCSTSISDPKLAQFKTAVIEALQYLNPRDGFNVVSFKDSPRPLFDRFAPVKPEYIHQATGFVKSLVRGGMTDVFAGLRPFVGSDRPAKRPLNIFLLSDGKTTVKNSPTNAEFIRKIVQLNRANVSIYSFSAGRNANLFLLDLLAYNNRGKSLHEDRLRDFKKRLVHFIGTHSDLIIADLEYHVTGGLGGEIYPKQLPHLYRGETLSVYGRYPAGTGELALSLVGRDAQGRLEEFLFRSNVKKAPKASARLAVEWASQKLYHLISRNTLAPDPSVVAQVRRIAEQYNLFVPYL